MEPIEELVAKAKFGLKRGVDPLEVDAWLAQQTGGKIKSLAQAESVLRGQKQGRGSTALLHGLQGALLGFGDEFLGALSGLISDAPYKERRDAARQVMRDTRAAYPKTSVGTELVGAAAAPVGLAGRGAKMVAAPLTGALERTAVGGLLGGLTGAVAGAGYSEGETAPEIAEDVVGGALLGGGVGAVVGLALKPLLGAVGGLGGLIKRLVAPEKAVRDQTYNEAVKLLTNAGLSPQQAHAELVKLTQQTGGEAILADVSPTLGRYLRSARNVNPALEAPLDALAVSRQGGQARRLAGSLEAEMGVTGAGARETRQATSAAMRPLAERVYGPLAGQSAGPDVLAQLGEQPEVLGLLARQRPRPGAPADAPPSFEQVQQLIRDMRDMAGKAFKSGAGNEGKFWAEQAEQLQKNLELSSPGAQKAGAAYRVGAETNRAFSMGAKALEKAEADVRAEVGRLRRIGGEEAVDAYRMGFVEKLTTQLRSQQTNRNIAGEIMKLGDEKKRIYEVLFPTPESLARFLQRVQAEHAMARTNQAVFGGSTTALQGADAVSTAGDVVVAGATGGAPGAGAALARAGVNKLMTETARRAKSNVAQELLMQRPSPELDRVLAMLASRHKSAAERAMLLRSFGQLGLPVYGGAAAGRAQR